MKLTNNPKDFTSAQWPQRKSYENENIIYCGELQRRYRYKSEPGSYSLYMTADRVTYQKVKDGQVLIPAFSLFGAPSYRIHLVLVRNDIRYEFEDTYSQYLTDTEDMHYNEQFPVKITVIVKNISQYISQCLSLSNSDIGSLIKKELSNFCRSRDAYNQMLWKEQFSTRVKKYGLYCCYIKAGRPVASYSSLPEHLREHNQKIKEKENAKHKNQLDNIKELGRTKTESERDQIRMEDFFRHLETLPPGISSEDIFKIFAIIKAKPEILKDYFDRYFE